MTFPEFCAIVRAWETQKEYDATLRHWNSGVCGQHAYLKKASVRQKSLDKSVCIANRSVAGHYNWKKKAAWVWSKPVEPDGSHA